MTCMPNKKTHNVYVVELDKKVWTDSWKFRSANPHYRGVSQCLYVGMTSHHPEERLEKHKRGYRNKKGIKISSWYVEKYGKYLRPSLYAPLNPLTRNQAKKIESSLAQSLRKRGYAVWFN